MSEPVMLVLSTAVITDVVRALNHCAMVKSMQQQERKPDVMYASVYGDNSVQHMLDLPELYKGKFMRTDNTSLGVIHRKSKHQLITLFRQLKYLVEKKCTKLAGDDTWCLFTDDDGLWHPDRVAMFEDAVRLVHTDRDITSVAIVNRTHIVDRERYEKTKVETCAQVDMLCAEGALRIDGWIPQANAAVPQPDTLELTDVCVRLSVVRQFFKETADDLLQNMYCTEQFCNYVATVPGKRTFYLQARHWHFFWRAADPRYTYCTGVQLASMTFPVNNHVEMIRYIQKVAEMASMPCMKESAAQTLRNILDALKDRAERAMIEFEYERAMKDKPWLRQ